MKNGMRTLGFLALAVPLTSLMPMSASASSVDVAGLTFSAEADSDYPNCCRAVQGGARVGNYYGADYQSHGLSEFDLGGLAGQALPGSVATVSFDLTGFSNIFAAGRAPTGNIWAGTYRGDNQMSFLDYFPPEYRPLTVFSLDNAVIGQHFSFDVTNAFGTALANQAPALGLLLRYSGADSNFASFGNFVLDVSTGAAVTAVPEPATWGLMLAGLVTVGALRKRRTLGRAPRDPAQSA